MLRELQRSWDGGAARREQPSSPGARPRHGAKAGCSRGWCKAFIKHLIVQNSIYGDIYS